jgi:16S rRNA (cytosine967-C5)-methyltransferase
VLIDAPCTGSGTWRRRPDAKWKLRAEAVVIRVKEQRAVLSQAAQLVKPGGRLIYVTCSILPQENADQIAWFTSENAAFRKVPVADVWRSEIGTEPPASADGSIEHLLLTPNTHGTDGFFVAVLERQAT